LLVGSQAPSLGLKIKWEARWQREKKEVLQIRAGKPEAQEWVLSCKGFYHQPPVLKNRIKLGTVAHTFNLTYLGS
jgi:hypothetical protein